MLNHFCQQVDNAKIFPGYDYNMEQNKPRNIAFTRWERFHLNEIENTLHSLLYLTTSMLHYSDSKPLLDTSARSILRNFRTFVRTALARFLPEFLDMYTKDLQKQEPALEELVEITSSLQEMIKDLKNGIYSSKNKGLQLRRRNAETLEDLFETPISTQSMLNFWAKAQIKTLQSEIEKKKFQGVLLLKKKPEILH